MFEELFNSGQSSSSNAVAIGVCLLASVVLLKALWPIFVGILESIWEFFKIAFLVCIAIIAVAFIIQVTS